VFLHLLPEIAEGNESIGEALPRVLEPTPLTDLGIFLGALAGLTTTEGTPSSVSVRMCLKWGGTVAAVTRRPARGRRSPGCGVPA
jgi:hypothetical protein